MSDCRFGVSPVNYPDPDPDQTQLMDGLMAKWWTDEWMDVEMNGC